MLRRSVLSSCWNKRFKGVHRTAVASYQYLKSLEDFPDGVKYYCSRDPNILENEIPLTEKPKSFTSNQFFWESQPRTIFITRKETKKSLEFLYTIATWVKSKFPKAKLLIEESNIGELAKTDLPIYVFPSSQKKELSRITDVIICLGGDGR